MNEDARDDEDKSEIVKLEVPNLEYEVNTIFLLFLEKLFFGSFCF